MNGSASITFTPAGVPTSGSLSVGGGKSSSDMAWVSEQSGFFAKDKLDVYVEKHTQLNGAVLNSDTGQLTLDTGTLGFKDIKDHDTDTSISGQVGVSYTADYDADGDGVVDEGSGGPGGNVSGGYASHVTEQDTKATIGKGEIRIRDKDKQKQDVAEINRDVTQSQVITKDEREGVQVFVSDTSIKVATDVLEKVGATLKDAFTASVGGRQDIDPKTAKAAGKLIEDMLTGKIKPGDLRGCVQSGFNLHDLLFTPAYASGACGEYDKETVDLCLSFLDKMKEGFVQGGADFAELLVKRVQEDPKGFEENMKLLDLLPSSVVMKPIEDKIKAEIQKNPDDVNAIAATVNAYFAEQKEMIENGEISREVAVASVVGIILVTLKATSKSVRQKVLEKSQGLLGNVLTFIKSRGHNVGFDTSNLKDKIANYLLDPTKPENKGKTEWFKQALGFTQENWNGLAKQIVFDPKKAVFDGADQYGTRYTQNIFIKGANGKKIEVTFAFIKPEGGKVRLVTVLPRAK